MLRTLGYCFIAFVLGAALAYESAARSMERAYDMQMHMNEASLQREQVCRADLARYESWYQQLQAAAAERQGKAKSEVDAEVAAILSVLLR